MTPNKLVILEDADSVMSKYVKRNKNEVK